MSDHLAKGEQTNQIEDACKHISCPLCWMPLFPAWQFDCCGERICLHCVEYYGDKRPPRCPSLTCHVDRPNIQPDKGFDNDHQHKKIQCKECTWYGDFTKLRDHALSHCKWRCDNCLESFIDEIPLATHKRLLCPSRYVECPLSPYGCINEIRYADLETHYSKPEHLKVLTYALKKLLNLMTDVTQEKDAKIKQEENRRAFLSTLFNGIATFQEQLVEISDRKNIVQGKQQAIMTQIVKLHEELLKIQAALADEKLFKEVLEMWDDLRSSIDDYHSSSSKMVRIIMQNDGIFTLKVNLVVLSRKESETIDSEVFQSSNWGYKMQISAAISSSSSSSNQHMVVFFSLIQGSYDDILSWPFPFPFTFRLVDLTGSGQHITRNISPDPKQSCFLKPDGRIHPKYHINQFCPLEKLLVENSLYVQENSMILQLCIHYLDVDELSTFATCNNVSPE